MDSRTDPHIGTHFADEAVEHVLARANEFCAAEVDYLTRTNEPQIVALRAQLTCSEGRRRDLKNRLQGLPPPGDLCARRWRSRSCWAEAERFKREDGWRISVASASRLWCRSR